MALLDFVAEEAKRRPQRVVFPEAHDETMMRAAARIAAEGYAECILVGDTEELQRLCEERGISQDTFRYLSTTDDALISDVAERYGSLPGMFLGTKAIARRCEDPLYLSLALQAVGQADVTFAGIEASTGDVITAAQLVIGMEDGIDTASSIAVCRIPDRDIGENGLIAFGDSAVCVNPSAEELAEIAISSCGTIRDLMGWEPRCALLSHSTCGSARNELAGKVVEATLVANNLRPDLAIDGELQLDSALSPRVAARKVTRESAVAGAANIIIWPDLDAGNIGVKLISMIPGVELAGPFLQGFRQIVGDCSRGAGVDDIVNSVIAACVRAGRLAERSQR